MTPADLAPWVEQMRALGVLRLKTCATNEYSVIPVEIDLAPAGAIATSGEPVPRDFAEAPRCRCGHERDAEHNHMGCLLGCDPAACAEPTQADP